MKQTNTTIRTVIICSLSVLCALSLLSSTSTAQERVMLGVRFQGDTTIISTLVGGGPAELAGVQLGDEILSVNEAYVLQPRDVSDELRRKRPKDVVTLEIKRGDEIIFLDLKLIKYVRADDVYGEDRPKRVELRDLGLAGQKAPNWTVEHWSRLPEGTEDLKVNDLDGKTVYLLCFQSSCAASRRQAVPLLKRVMDAHEGDSTVVFFGDSNCAG